MYIIHLIKSVGMYSSNCDDDLFPTRHPPSKLCRIGQNLLQMVVKQKNRWTWHGNVFCLSTFSSQKFQGDTCEWYELYLHFLVGCFSEDGLFSAGTWFLKRAGTCSESMAGFPAITCNPGVTWTPLNVSLHVGHAIISWDRMPTLIAGTKPIQILHFAIYTGCSFSLYIYIFQS